MSYFLAFIAGGLGIAYIDLGRRFRNITRLHDQLEAVDDQMEEEYQKLVVENLLLYEENERLKNGVMGE